MKYASAGNQLHGRLAALDVLLSLCWLSGVGLGCICGALADCVMPTQMLVLLNRGSRITGHFVPFFDLAVVCCLWGIGGGDFILPTAFFKGFGDAFVLCLLLSAPGCIGWPCLLAPFGLHFVLVPAQFAFGRWILRDSCGSKPLQWIVLYCICVFLCFVFMSVF